MKVLLSPFHKSISKKHKVSAVCIFARGCFLYIDRHQYCGVSATRKDLAKNIQLCYTYDDFSRVTKRTTLNLADSSSSEETFAYDAAGNLIGDHEENVYEYDSDNRLYSYNYCPVSYDADGNTTYAYLDSKTNRFEYDSANRLIKAGEYAYTYNAEDVRIRSTYGTNRTSYVYDTNARLSRLLVKETDGTATKYVYGLGLIGEIRTGPFKTYHFDYRGSTVAVTSECGTEMGTFTYDTYGKLLSRTGRFKPIFLYNGRDGVVTDPNGLLYMRARYYSPELRRFMNADLLAGDISDARTLNRYSYVCGDPVSFVDPFGLSAERGDLDKNQVVNSAPLRIVKNLIDSSVGSDGFKVSYVADLITVKNYENCDDIYFYIEKELLNADVIKLGLSLLGYDFSYNGSEIGIVQTLFELGFLKTYVSQTYDWEENSGTAIGISLELPNGVILDQQVSVEIDTQKTAQVTVVVLLIIALVSLNPALAPMASAPFMPVPT